MSIWHPEPAEIAALDEDLLTPAESQQIREHLAGCGACADVARDLELLRGELSGLEPVEPMPEDVAARIDRALAAEAARSLVAEPDAPLVRGAGAEEELVSRETSERRPPAQRGRRPHFVLAAVGALLALGVGGLLAQQLNGESASDAAAPHSVTENGDVPEAADEASLEQEVRVLLSLAEEDAEELAITGDDDLSPEAGEAAGGEQDAAGDGQARTLTSVPACITAVIDRNERPLAASEDYRYEGVPSYVVVLPHSADRQLVDAYVVDASCADDGSSPDPDDLLTRQSYPR